MFAYCKDAPNRRFHVGEVGITVSGSRANLHFFHRDGYAKKPCTLVGQGILY